MRRPRPQQRDTLPLRLPDGRDIELLRVVDPRARRLRLLVSARGPRLTVPPAVGAAEAERFLIQHLPWLAEQLKAIANTVATATPLSPFEPGTIPLRGERIELEWRQSHCLRAARDGERLSIHLPPDLRPGALGRILRDFYLTQARADVSRWLPRYLPDLPRPPREWRIRPLASLWGSLSTSGSMSLDMALVLAPPAAFEYVLVHELCHLIQHNHSRAFWREVEHRFPDWRTQRRWLREEGMEMKHELRRLLAP
ncbi:SprT family zinc-dependent metalloprotease [Xanthomonadaceae bacterium JHOS43]|nr:SprT family zinc-dependent metalloprotease [Xanthomonadaceae bacterium JHOS43]MCX7564110.1 SprT family zinc-dependent metalloprotease [Xanthomonadaceae bacterium XH05]